MDTARAASRRKTEAHDERTTLLLLGEGDLADEVRRALEALDAEVVRLLAPTQREVAQVFERGEIERAVVVSGDDAFAIRAALMVREADEDVELLVTYDDQNTAGQLCERIGNCTIVSAPDIVAPILAGPTLDGELGAVRLENGRAVGARTDGSSVEDVEVDLPRRHRIRPLVNALLLPYDKSAALMFYGLIGLLVILLSETVLSVIVLDQSVVDAFYGSAKTLATVDPNDPVKDGPSWFKTVVAIMMLIAVAFEAFFTAGIVNRLVGRRLTGLVGQRAVPRRDHVIVVGLGQVGLRLALLLRDLGVAVVAVDELEEGENVGFAREAGLPVVIGRGGDPSLLRRLSLTRAHALAAVTDDDLANLSIGMSALAVDEDVRLVLRVGDGRLANETRALFQLGIVRDVHRVAAAFIAARAIGKPAETVICHDDRAHLVHGDGTVEEAALAAAS